MNSKIKQQFILFLILLVVALPISVSVYFKAYGLPAASQKTNQVITNKYVLQNVLPDSVIDIVAKQSQLYLSVQDISIKSFYVSDTPSTQDGAYVFTLKSQDGKQTLHISAVVTGGSVMSLVTSINGVVQPDLNSPS